MHPSIPYLLILLIGLLSKPAGGFGLGLREIEKFKFLPLESHKQWGVHLEGAPTGSYNEWDLSNPSCRPVYESYLHAYNAKEWVHIGDLIYNVSNCILDSSSTFQQQTVQASAVLLGFSPIMLSAIGPTLSEVALVSLHRPCLALIFSLGTAAVSPTRMLCTYDDTPRNVLGRLNSSDRLLHTWLIKQSLSIRRSRYLYVVVGVLQYLLALVAAVNVLYTSLQLGITSISVLDCDSSFHPLLWSLFPLITHAIVCVTYHRDHASRKKRKQPTQLTSSIVTCDNVHQSSGRVPDISGQPRTLTQDQNQIQIEHKDSSVVNITSSSLEQGQGGTSVGDGNLRNQWPGHSSWLLHLLPSSCHHSLPAWIMAQQSMKVDLAHRLSTILAFIQTIYGVVAFSSLLFVAVGDAAVILLRLLASVIACRIVIMLDLGGMRWEIEEKEEGEEREGECGSQNESGVRRFPEQYEVRMRSHLA